MYSPATPGYVVIDDVSLTMESASRAIVAGQWTIFMSAPPVGEFELSGDGFGIEGTYNAGLVVPAQTCAAACAPGQILSTSTRSSTTTHPSSSRATRMGLHRARYRVPVHRIRIRWFPRARWRPGDAADATRGNLPELVTVSAPFVLSGTFKGYEVVGVREPKLLFQVSLTGRGTATLKLLSGPAPGGGVQLTFSGLSYVFEP